MENLDAKVSLAEKDGKWYATMKLTVPIADNEDEVTATLVSSKLADAFTVVQREYQAVTVPPQKPFEHEFHPPLPNPAKFA